MQDIIILQRRASCVHYPLVSPVCFSSVTADDGMHRLGLTIQEYGSLRKKTGPCVVVLSRSDLFSRHAEWDRHERRIKAPRL